MAYENLSEILMNLKRKARLSGRPLTKQEVAGVTTGYAGSTRDRLIQMKQLEEQRREHQANLSQRKYETEKELEAAAAREESAKRRDIMAATTSIGSIWGPPGAAIGAGVGYGLSKCIIISACTSPESYEVNIAREFRDKYLDLISLDGYYSLGKKLVPIIKRFRIFKYIIKHLLVNSLVDYGEWILEYKQKVKRRSIIVSGLFLSFCRYIGRGNHHE